MVKRISVALSQDELNALIGMAEANCRHPREQIRFVLRKEMVKHGLLDLDSEGEQQNTINQSASARSDGK